MIASILLLSLVTQVIPLWPQDKFEPLYGSGYDSPQRLLSKEAKPGDTVITIDVIKCIDWPHPLVVTGARWFHLLTDGGETRIPLGVGVSEFDPDSCEPRIFQNKVPLEATPGKWRWEGINIAHLDDKEHRRFWHTEPITVIE